MDFNSLILFIKLASLPQGFVLSLFTEHWWIASGPSYQQSFEVDAGNLNKGPLACMQVLYLLSRLSDIGGYSLHF